MAMITKLVDDLDGSDVDVRTRRFSIGAVRYAIDLSDKNFEEMLRCLEPYIAVAVVESGAPVTGGVAQGKVGPVYGDASVIKAFAQSIGATVPVSRPTNELVRRWIAANPEATAVWEKQTGKIALDHYR